MSYTEEHRRIDAEIHRRYHTTQYLLIQAGDVPDLNEVPNIPYGPREMVEATRSAKINPHDWQIIEVTTKPVEPQP